MFELSGVVASTFPPAQQVLIVSRNLRIFHCLGDPIGSAPRRVCHCLAIFLASLVARATPGSAIAGGGGRGRGYWEPSGKGGKCRVEMLLFSRVNNTNFFLQKLLGSGNAHGIFFCDFLAFDSVWVGNRRTAVVGNFQPAMSDFCCKGFMIGMIVMTKTN